MLSFLIFGHEKPEPQDPVLYFSNKILFFTCFPVLFNYVGISIMYSYL